MNDRQVPEAIPRLHLVTNDEVLGRETAGGRPSAALAAACRAGGGRMALHIRAPGWEGRALLEASQVVARVAEPAGVHLVVNDRVDVALALEVALGVHVFGVQLGRRSLPPADVRALLDPVGSGARIGQSVRGGEAADPAADFLLVGTLWPSDSHPGRPGAGPEAVGRGFGADAPPRIGIGGLLPSRVAPVLAAGGHGVAVLRGVWSAPDPGAAVSRFLEALDAGAGNEEPQGDPPRGPRTRHEEEEGG